MLRGYNLEKLSRPKAGVCGIRTDWSGICGGPGWLAGWVWGQESCCSTVCSEHSGHSVEAEQLSHCSPWPQDSDTAPCSPQVTQHCLCFLYTTCSTACKQLQSWACRLRTDSRGSLWRSCSWCSAKWGSSPLLKLSSASCRSETCLCASSSACLALSASVASRTACTRDSSPSALNAAHDWAVCLQLWPHCLRVRWASSSSCLRRVVSAQGPEGSSVGGVPGEPWPDGKCSQIFELIPLSPKELWAGPRKVLSDWPCWDRWEEKNGAVCGLTGGDGDGELNGAEEPKDPGILTGAELWNWLLPSIAPTLGRVELLSKLLSNADTPKSLRSRSSRADSTTDSTVSLVG